ncbi:hypothetical protein NE237_020263 [Protea cynaroides]|uniref:Uncharacterized protein n=1 Tax=Protea cynaroides TaxID=273540 RepID=A0A9Q0H8R2_9MAGN|nr:hypothetical protein NE237_020263 [Protea cynaroides]
MGRFPTIIDSLADGFGDNLEFTLNPLDPEEFRRQGHMIIDFLTNYYRNIKKYPIQSQVKPSYLHKRLPTSAPNHPEPIQTILQNLLGEMLSTGFNVVGFNWFVFSAVTELETMLPNCFLFSDNGGGLLQGTTCEAILCTLIASRDRMLNTAMVVVCEAILCTLIASRDQMLNKIGRDNIGTLVAAQMVGIHPNNFRLVSTSRSTAFRLSPDSLWSVILVDLKAGLVPLFLYAIIYRHHIYDRSKEFGIWAHVNAVYVGSACICPEFRGMENANSLSFNAHKWFFTTLDFCCLWVKDPIALIKALSTCYGWKSSSRFYLRNKATETNTTNTVQGHEAKHFEGLVTMDKRFEIVVPTTFAMVRFQLLPLPVTVNADGWMNSSGRVYMTHAMVGGVYMIRFAVGTTLTEEERHMIAAWKVIQEHADVILSTY